MEKVHKVPDFRVVLTESLAEVEERLERERKLSPAPTPISPELRKKTQGRIVHDGKRFCSRREAACARMLELCLDEFFLQYGDTYQVLVQVDQYGNGITVDFRIGDLFLEIHEAWFIPCGAHRGGFESREEQQLYQYCMDLLGTVQERAEYQQEIEQLLLNRYFAHRRHILDCHPSYFESELVVASEAEQVLDAIESYRRDSSPSDSELIEHWNLVFGEAEDVSPFPKHQAKRKAGGKSKKKASRRKSRRRIA